MSKSDDNPVDIIYGQVEIREVKFLRGRYDLRLFFLPVLQATNYGPHDKGFAWSTKGDFASVANFLKIYLVTE